MNPSLMASWQWGQMNATSGVNVGSCFCSAAFRCSAFFLAMRVSNSSTVISSSKNSHTGIFIAAAMLRSVFTVGWNQGDRSLIPCPLDSSFCVPPRFSTGFDVAICDIKTSSSWLSAEFDVTICDFQSSSC